MGDLTQNPGQMLPKFFQKKDLTNGSRAHDLDLMLMKLDLGKPVALLDCNSLTMHGSVSAGTV
jgi:hypothetical protein